MKQEILAHFGIFNLIGDVFKGRKKFRDLFSTRPMDITFLALVIAVLTIGIIMMFSASYVNAMYGISEESGGAYYYVKNQAVFAIIGVVMMILLSHLKSDIFRQGTGVVTVIALLLLVYVLINPHIVPGKEQFKRWVEIPVIGSFQPSEIAKLAVVMFLAFSMERYHKIIEQKWWVIFPYGGFVLLFCALVYMQQRG